MAADVSVDIELITTAFNKALKESGDLVGGFKLKMEKTEKGVTTSFSKIEKSAKSTSKGFTVLKGSIASFLGNLASNAVSSFVSSLGGLAGSIVENTIRLEQLETQFTVLTGSAEIAGKTLRDIQQFAASTPFQLEGIATAGAQLISFGVAADDLIPRLQRIGDVAAAAGQPIKEVSLIFGQVAAAGKLTGERLLQFQERAIPIGPALAKTLGVAESAVKDLVSEGVVDFKTFEKAFDSLSSEGGQAFQGMIKQSKTLGGLISTLKDNFTLLGTDIGAVLLPALKEAATALLVFIDQNKELAVSIATQAISALATGISLLIRSFNVVSAVVDAAVLSFEGLKLLMSELVGFAVSASRAVIDLALATQELVGSDPSPTLLKLKDSLDAVKEASNKTTEDIELNINKRREARLKEGQGLQELADRISAFGDGAEQAEKDYTDTVLTQQQKRAAADKAAAQLRAETERERNAAIAEVQQEFKDEQEVAKIDAQIAIEEFDGAEIERIRELELQKIEVIKQAELEKAELQKSVGDKAKAEETARQKARLATIKVNSDTELAIKKKQAEDEKAIAAGTITAAKGFLAAGSTLAKQGSKEAKVLGIADATINTYVGASKALATIPPPASFAVAASVIAQGLATVSKISSTGSFAQGGVIPGGSFAGDNLTANVNSNEVILNPRQAANTLFQVANSNKGSSGGDDELLQAVQTLGDRIESMEIVLQADDTEIARSTSRGVSNGVVIGVSA